MNSKVWSDTGGAGDLAASAESERLEILETARENFREGNYRVAESLLEHLILAGQVGGEIYHMLGTIYYDQGKFNKAVRTFRRALEIDPGFTDASVGLSIILNDLGRYAEAKQVFETAQAHLARQKNGSERERETQIRLARKHEELGDMYFQSKLHALALSQFEQALALNKNPELLMKQVAVLRAQGDQVKAMERLQNIIQDFPYFVAAKVQLGVELYNLKKVTAAIEKWEEVLLQDPKNTSALRHLEIAKQSGGVLLY